MDAKEKTTKLVKDLQDSTREMAHFGLQTVSKAIDFTVGTLSSLKDEVSKTADKLKVQKAEETQVEPPK